MGVLHVTTRTIDLIHHRHARRRWAWRREVIAVHDEDRDMLQGIDLSWGQIPEATCFELDDALNFTS